VRKLAQVKAGGARGRSAPTSVGAQPRWIAPNSVPTDDPYAPDSVALYRLFNVAGALLYVGISDAPKRRFQEHAESKRWWYLVSRWTVTWYPDRATATAAEASAIITEVPAYNVAGVPTTTTGATAEEWLTALHRRRPTLDELDYLFRVLMCTRSLPPTSSPRMIWPVREAEDVYFLAWARASRFTLWCHKQTVEQWNDEQITAWYAHVGKPIPIGLRS
jgi:predicted GIY-YIG superfamily endonuclease